MSDTQQETVFACDLTTLTPEQRQYLGTLSSELFAVVQNIRELSDGYAFELLQDSSLLLKLADFITYDRLCCPFMFHGIDAEPLGGSIWLRLSGEEGTKAFVIAEISGLLKPEVARSAGFSESVS